MLSLLAGWVDAILGRVIQDESERSSFFLNGAGVLLIFRFGVRCKGGVESVKEGRYHRGGTLNWVWFSGLPLNSRASLLDSWETLQNFSFPRHIYCCFNVLKEGLALGNCRVSENS